MILQQITFTTWFFIASLILSLIGYTFKVDKRVVFFFAKRNKQWAVQAAIRIKDEMEQKKIRNRHKRLQKYIKRANEISKSLNGRRIYILPVLDDFVIVDSSKGKEWLRTNHFDSSVVLSNICVYYTPVTLLTKKN